MDDLDRFFELFIETLSSVDKSYYSTTYRSIINLKHALRYRGRFVGNDFEYFGERIFCYELYHQLRIKIDRELENNPDFLQGAMLQGEVKKIRASEFVEHLGLEQLSQEFIPDFLIHTPGDTDYHAFVIEVKCSPNLSRRDLLADIKKINEFVTRYQYERGIFLTINSDPISIGEKLSNARKEISALDGKDKIKVICKQSQSSKAKIWQL